MRKLMMRVVLALISMALVCPLTGTAGAQGPPDAFGQRWTQPQGAVQPDILPPGATFAFDRAFSGRIVSAELKPYLVAGGQEIPAIGYQQFLVVTIELTNNATVGMASPVRGLKWLSTRDGMTTIRTAPLTTRINDDPRLGGAAITPIGPGATGKLLAIYQVPATNFDPGSVYYTVEADMANGRLVLAALPR
jgi:hypothetical protein